MKSVFDKLNLRPLERRLLVGAGVVVFLVVQFLYVWPHFGDVEKMNLRRSNALDRLKVHAEEFAQTNKYFIEVKKLEGAGLSVPPEDQATDLQRTVLSQAAQSMVSITASSKPFTRTNESFLEQSMQVTTVSTEEALVNFLYNLGSGASLIRVRDLTLRPDPTRMKLTATIKLVASYKKTFTTRPAPGAAKPPAAAPGQPKPAVPAPAKPGLPKPSNTTKKTP